MNLTGLLQEALTPATIGQIGQAIGADEQTTGNAINAALPALLGGLAGNSSSASGASALLGALDRDHDGSVLDDLAGLIGTAGAGQGTGEALLGHILGGQLGTVTQAVSQASGLEASRVGPLLGILAPIVMGAVGRFWRASGNQGGAGDLAGLLAGATSQAGAGDLLGMVTNLLDRDKDGSAVDDVVGMLGGFFKK